MDFENLKTKKIIDASRLIEKGHVCQRNSLFLFRKISSDSSSKDVFTQVFKRSALESAKDSKSKSRVEKGILDGIPISVKDLADVSQITGGGSYITNKKKARINAFVDDLQSQGVIILGKTHMTELAFSGLGLNPLLRHQLTHLTTNLFLEDLPRGRQYLFLEIIVLRQLDQILAGQSGSLQLE